MSKTRIVAALAALTMAGLAACGSGGTSGSGDTDEAGKTLAVAVTSSPSADALKALAKEFTAETGIDVSFVELPYEQLTPKVLLAASEKSATYDIVQFDSPDLAALSAAEALADIGGYVDGSTAYDADDFPESVQTNTQVGGVTYAIPLSSEPYVLFSNGKMLEELGLEPADTVEEYLANAKAFSAAGYGGSGFPFGPTISSYWWLEAVHMFGGGLTEPGTCNATLDSPEAKAATEFYFETLPYATEAAINGHGGDANTSYAQGELGQLIVGTGHYSIDIDPEQSQVVDDIVMTLPPSGPNGRHTLLFGWLVGVTANSQAQDEAWQFLEYALGKDKMNHLIEVGGPPPARLSITESDVVKEAVPYVDLLVEAASYGQHLTYTPVMGEVITELSVLLSEAAASGMSPDDFVEQAQETASSILSEADVCE